MERGFSSVAVAASIVSIGLGVIYWLARIGFVTPLAPIAASIGLALLLINLPVIIWRLTRSKQPGWARSYSFIWLTTFVGVAAIGRFVVGIGSAMTLPVTIAGSISFAVVALWWVREAPIRFAVVLVAGSAFFSTWVGGVVWGRIYKSPLFMETLIGTGIVHHDGVTLAALGNMLRTYHVASMGLDGVSYMAYHWGSPWLFAQLSNLTGQSVLAFYQLGYPVTIIPLFFGSIIACAVQLSEHDVTRSWITWPLFIAATIGVMPVTGMDALGVWTSNLVISESYAVAIPIALMLLSTVVMFWKERGNAVLTGNAGVADFGFLAIVLAGGLVILGYVKISFMILGFGALAYAALRIGAWKRWPLLAIALWTTAIVAVTYKRVSLVAHHEGVVPLDFLESFVSHEWWPFFVLAQLFWSLLYVVLRLRQENARTVHDVIALARERKVLDVEVVAVVAIAGILPGFVLHIDGGSAFYFSDVQRWLALSLILASAATLIPRVEWNRMSALGKLGVAFLLFPFLVSTARNSVHWTTRMLRANAELRHSLYPPAERNVTIAGIRSLPHLADPVKLDAGLKSSVNYNPVMGLLSLAGIPLGEKEVTAVFVPQNEQRYWTILKRPGACAFSGFVVPSLTGMAMIDGMPAADCKLSPYYGLSLFPHRTTAQVEADTARLALCRKARAAGFRQVIKLHFDVEGRMSRNTIGCGSG